MNMEDRLSGSETRRGIIEDASSRVEDRIFPDAGTGTRRRHYICHLCSKNFAFRSSLHRHRKRVHETVKETVICVHCGFSFSKPHIKAHESACGQKLSLKRRPSCTHSGCCLTFPRKEDVILHLKSHHGYEIKDVEKYSFKSFEDFLDWKDKEEQRTYSFYTKQGGKTKALTKCYYCQRDGHGDLHRKRSEISTMSRRRNAKGRIKTGDVCISLMRVKQNEDGSVDVRYWPTHSHPLSPSDMKHHRLSTSTVKFIEQQIMKNVPLRQIQANLKKRALVEKGQEITRESFVTIKRLASMAARLRRGEHGVAIDTMEKYVEALNCGEDSSIILYCPTNIEDEVEASHRFVLGIQTKDQQDMLQRDCITPLFVGITFEGDEYGTYVLSLFVPTEDNGEYPVGHLVTNTFDEEIISLFFRTLGEKCPNLNISCIVSEHNHILTKALHEVFGDGPVYISKWHILEVFREHMSKTVSKDLKQEMLFILVALVEATNEEDFINLSDDFQLKYGVLAPDFCSFLSEYLAKAPLWAMCYRDCSETMDSALFVNSFRNKLAKAYKKRLIKKVSLIPELLLHMQDQYKSYREKLLLGNVESILIDHHHNASEDMHEKNVKCTSTNHWSFTGSKKELSHHVMRCAQMCFNSECLLQCLKCYRLCSHLYFCTCSKGREICKHIHKVHSMVLSSEEEADVSPGVVECMYVEEDPAIQSNGVNVSECVSTIISSHASSPTSNIVSSQVSDKASHLTSCSVSGLISASHLTSCSVSGLISHDVSDDTSNDGSDNLSNNESNDMSSVTSNYSPNEAPNDSSKDISQGISNSTSNGSNNASQNASLLEDEVEECSSTLWCNDDRKSSVLGTLERLRHTVVTETVPDDLLSEMTITLNELVLKCTSAGDYGKRVLPPQEKASAIVVIRTKAAPS